jgi:hypothetical protein
VPFITERWAPHVGVEWGAQFFLSSLEEYNPEVHGEHAASEDDDPAE